MGFDWAVWLLFGGPDDQLHILPAQLEDATWHTPSPCHTRGNVVFIVAARRGGRCRGELMPGGFHWRTQTPRWVPIERPLYFVELALRCIWHLFGFSPIRLSRFAALFLRLLFPAQTVPLCFEFFFLLN
jgi:hypothetical protein